MSLMAALSVTTSGLGAIERQLALVSQNVANAGTAGYATESAAPESVAAGGQGMGVTMAPATTAVNQAMQNAVLTQNAEVSGLSTQQSALQGIDAVMGTPAQGNDLASLVGAVQDGFSTLLADPSNATQQQAVVSQAQTLAQGINTIAETTIAARQTAQDNIVSGVASLNQALATIGGLNAKIVSQQQQGLSIADLQNARATAMQSVTQLIGANFLTQPDGAVLVATQSGMILPTNGTAALSTSDATLAPQNGAPPAIMLGGADVTAALTGGSLGANIALRDGVLPQIQAGLDEFSQTLAGRFSAQGLNLFTDAQGNVPAGGGSPVQSGYLGFSATIQVNPAVLANPALVRDGTQAVAGSAGGAAAFTPNPSGGPAGYTTLISRVLDQALGTEVQSGVTQPAANTSGLGPNGTLSLGFPGTGALGDLAAALTGAEAATSSNVSQNLTTQQGVQTNLQTQLSTQSGVNVDAQMSQMVALQNAYGANARVITAVQAMWTALMATTPT